jgi:hypothetical protein
VPRRRAVVEMTVAWKQAAPIPAGHVVEMTRQPHGADLPGTRSPPSPSIRFTVRYRLREYLAIVGEYLPRRLLELQRSRAKARPRRLGWGARLILALMVPLVGGPLFLLKRRRMPVCRFTIDAERIRREAGGRVLSVPWADVVAVHRLAGAWMIDKGDGAMPLPFRCLGAAQREAFERLLASRFPPVRPA